MRVVVLAPGTRGDAAAAAGLGHRLRTDGGHDVALVADAGLAGLVRDAGCSFHPAPLDLGAMLDSAGDTALRAAGPVIPAYLRALRSYFDSFATTALDAARDADVILVNSVASFGHDIAEGLRIPAVGAYLQPTEPSRAYPPPVLGSPRLTGIGNLVAGVVLRHATAPADHACARIRHEVGLPPRRRRAGDRARRRARTPIHHGISPAVLPRPADWRPELSLDGYWWPVPPPSWTPPPELTAFLAAGSPPVVAGFGSAALFQHALGEIVVPAARAAGARLILQSPEPIQSPGDDVLVVADVPHSWLFPRAAAVLHHGGAGTTAAGLRAGVPAVVLPLHSDQPFWGARVAALGAGPQPLSRSRLTVERLAEALRAVLTDPAYAAGARSVATRLLAEDGAAGMLAELSRLQTAA